LKLELNQSSLDSGKSCSSVIALQERSAWLTKNETMLVGGPLLCDGILEAGRLSLDSSQAHICASAQIKIRGNLVLAHGNELVLTHLREAFPEPSDLFVEKKLEDVPAVVSDDSVNLEHLEEEKKDSISIQSYSSLMRIFSDELIMNYDAQELPDGKYILPSIFSTISDLVIPQDNMQGLISAPSIVILQKDNTLALGKENPYFFPPQIPFQELEEKKNLLTDEGNFSSLLDDRWGFSYREKYFFDEKHAKRFHKKIAKSIVILTEQGVKLLAPEQKAVFLFSPYLLQRSIQQVVQKTMRRHYIHPRRSVNQTELQFYHDYAWKYWNAQEDHEKLSYITDEDIDSYTSMDSVQVGSLMETWTHLNEPQNPLVFYTIAGTLNDVPVLKPYIYLPLALIEEARSSRAGNLYAIDLQVLPGDLTPDELIESRSEEGHKELLSSYFDENPRVRKRMHNLIMQQRIKEAAIARRQQKITDNAERKQKNLEQQEERRNAREALRNLKVDIVGDINLAGSLGILFAETIHVSASVRVKDLILVSIGKINIGSRLRSLFVGSKKKTHLSAKDDITLENVDVTGAKIEMESEGQIKTETTKIQANHDVNIKGNEGVLLDATKMSGMKIRLKSEKGKVSLRSQRKSGGYCYNYQEEVEGKSTIDARDGLDISAQEIETQASKIRAGASGINFEAEHNIIDKAFTDRSWFSRNNTVSSFETTGDFKMHAIQGNMDLDATTIRAEGDASLIAHGDVNQQARDKFFWLWNNTRGTQILGKNLSVTSHTGDIRVSGSRMEAENISLEAQKGSIGIGSYWNSKTNIEAKDKIKISSKEKLRLTHAKVSAQSIDLQGGDFDAYGLQADVNEIKIDSQGAIHMQSAQMKAADVDMKARKDITLNCIQAEADSFVAKSEEGSMGLNSSSIQSKHKAHLSAQGNFSFNDSNISGTQLDVESEGSIHAQSTKIQGTDVAMNAKKNLTLKSVQMDATDVRLNAEEGTLSLLSEKTRMGDGSNYRDEVSGKTTIKAKNGVTLAGNDIKTVSVDVTSGDAGIAIDAKNNFTDETLVLESHAEHYGVRGNGLFRSETRSTSHKTKNIASNFQTTGSIKANALEGDIKLRSTRIIAKGAGFDAQGNVELLESYDEETHHTETKDLGFFGILRTSQESSTSHCSGTKFQSDNIFVVSRKGDLNAVAPEMRAENIYLEAQNGTASIVSVKTRSSSSKNTEAGSESQYQDEVSGQSRLEASNGIGIEAFNISTQAIEAKAGASGINFSARNSIIDQTLVLESNRENHSSNRDETHISKKNAASSLQSEENVKMHAQAGGICLFSTQIDAKDTIDPAFRTKI
jgi:hypothetical protein